MNYTDAMAILGKPSAENAFCTGKQYIPFYGGKDKGRTNYYYKGHGVVVFHTEVSTFGIGGYVSCTPKTPLEVSEVLYDANEAGVVPKDGGEARK